MMARNIPSIWMMLLVFIIPVVSIPTAHLLFHSEIDRNGTDWTQPTIQNINPTFAEKDVAVVPDIAWFDGRWNYRKAHIIQGSTHGELSDYQLRFEVHRGNGTDSGRVVFCGFNCTNNFEDLRFTQGDGITLCNYWIEEIITSPSRIAYVWVKIPTIPEFPANSSIYLYYGNNHALSLSNIDATFEAACDMEEGNLNEWDGSWGTATHNTSTNYPHTGANSLTMTPASGLPESSGRYIDVSSYDNYHAYRVWFYDTGTTTLWKNTNTILSDGPTDDYKVYMGCSGHKSNYSYWDGGSWRESNVTRSIGFHYFEFRHLDTTTQCYLDAQLIHTSIRLDEPVLNEFRVCVYRGYPESSYFDDLIVRKWVSPEPTHEGWTQAEQITFQWHPYPSNQVVYEHENVVYDVDAIPESWIDTWEINDTDNFAIDTEGVITNTSSLALGEHGVFVRVNSTYGDLLEAAFTINVIEQPILAEWTVLVFLDGDNDLEEYAFDDFNSMETIGSTAEVRIIVFVDFAFGLDAPYTGARCYEINQDNNPDLINSTQLVTGLPSEPNMGDWRILRDFIIFGQFVAPAHRYLLTLWNHGAGAYGLCSDDTSDDRLTIAELNLALSDPQVHPLDVVAFDACLMGQLEVAYEIRDTTELVVFSEEGVPLTGFPYEDILLNLSIHPNSTPKALATSMVYHYVTAYEVGGRYYDPIYDDICLSAIETSKIESVAQHLDKLAQFLLTRVIDPVIYETISWAREGTQGFSWADFIDLYSFADHVATVVDSSSVLFNLATNLSVTVQSAIYEEMHLSGIPEAYGLGAVFGSYLGYQLSLANDTGWDELMEAFIDIGSSFDKAVGLIANIGPQGAPNLHCGYLDGAQDSVYFIFTAPETGVYTFTLDAAWTQYITDFDLYIYDAYENTLDNSVSTDSSESITIHLHAGNTYYLEAYSYPSGYEGIGVFYLNIHTPSGPGPFPFLLSILGPLVAIGLLIALIVGVLAATYYFQRQPSSTLPPPSPRYTRPAPTPQPRPRTNEIAKFCAYCGAQIPFGARYCPLCGAPLN